MPDLGPILTNHCSRQAFDRIDDSSSPWVCLCAWLKPDKFLTLRLWERRDSDFIGNLTMNIGIDQGETVVNTRGHTIEILILYTHT